MTTPTTATPATTPTSATTPASGAGSWLAAAERLDPPRRLVVADGLRDAADGRTFRASSARDGGVLAEVAFAGPEDVDRAVAAARAAFEGGAWSRADPRHRRGVLLRFAELVEEHAAELALLDTLEVGKPIGDTTTVDVPGTAATLRYYAEAVDKRHGEVAPVPPDALALVTREPLGVVAAVVPWNYALLIAAWKLAPALATGNSVVLKPAEQSALASLRLVELGLAAGLPAGVLQCLPGDGPTTGAALGRHPDVDKVAFTGSAEVGRRFLEYAGQSNGKQVALECGGKSPQLVLADLAGDPDRLRACATSLAWGVFYNAGQTCNAGSRLVVDERVHDELLAELVEVARGFEVGDPLDPGTVVGPLVDAGQAERVLGHLAEATADGAEAVVGGGPVDGPTPGHYVAPTVLDPVEHASRVAQEEVFGPVLAVTSFAGGGAGTRGGAGTGAGDDAVAEGVRLANGTRYGLAASVWTGDVRLAHRVARALRAGTVWVNTFDASDVITPFGGFKESGSGRDKSLHALDAYTALKTTWLDLGSRLPGVDS